MKTFKESVKMLEADIQYANTLATYFPEQRSSKNVYFQMRLAYSPMAPFLLFLFKWTDCSLAGALGLMHVLVYKMHIDGATTMGSHEKRASLREFYGSIYPSLLQLQDGLSEKEMARQTSACRIRYPKSNSDLAALTEREREVQGEIERECGICMELTPKVGLPGCAHLMCFKCFKEWQERSTSCPFCRNKLGKVGTADLWVFVEISDAPDPEEIQKENFHRLMLFIEKLPLVFGETVQFSVYDVLY